MGARDEIVERLELAAASGEAKIAVGGKKIDSEGAYMEPALLTEVDRSSDVGCNEIFGPVAIVYKAKDVAEAIEIANDSDYGLSGSVWTTDLDKGREVAHQLDVGMAFVNESSATGAGLPFGGIGRSGYGRELERWGVGEFVNEKLYRFSGQSTPGLSPVI
ncbi:aldehyde dehydrogenase [Corynebacterium cystitidis]|uniref:Aldehyde dehydrogenase family protein n=1 Tax=Corynebacterium cystitidis DSM 20524 TaxID=1121357 RepID=A0A1H9QL56_9CORY|nr:Aldehyde dehydrogenase family protein [Corynebacterium cystitidis DSM 20524]SNV84293.1 aldehyde dehydrogenase [Corynebacterium cystitidis]